MDDSLLDACFDSVHNLVIQCGETALHAKLSNENIEMKSCSIDLVTEIDKKVEKTLIEGLSQLYPDHKFIGEESISDGANCLLTDDPTWIIDPIDGTMNFVHKFPHFCISIALFINKKPVIGIVYNPALNQMFTARKGKGAFLNKKPIYVSKETEISRALVMSEIGTSRDPEKLEVVIQNLTNLVTKVHGLRTLGSAALNMCMVAFGGADVNFEFGIHVWDIAAGILIVEEAGGVCIDPEGGELDLMSRRILCASSNKLAQEIAKELIQYYSPRD